MARDRVDPVIKRRGRPREDPAGRLASVTVQLPQARVDALAREAVRKGFSLSRVLRDRLFATEK